MPSRTRRLQATRARGDGRWSVLPASLAEVSEAMVWVPADEWSALAAVSVDDERRVELHAAGRRHAADLDWDSVGRHTWAADIDVSAVPVRIAADDILAAMSEGTRPVRHEITESPSTVEPPPRTIQHRWSARQRSSARGPAVPSAVPTTRELVGGTPAIVWLLVALTGVVTVLATVFCPKLPRPGRDRAHRSPRPRTSIS